MSTKLADVGGLPRVVARELKQAVNAQVESGHGAVVRLEIARVAGQEKSPLAGLCILDSRQQFISADQDRVGVNHSGVVRSQLLDVAVGDQTADQEERQDGRQSHSGPGFNS